MDEKEFEQEWMADPPEIGGRFYDLAMEYHRRAEAYDRTVCTRMKGGRAFPADGRELSLVNKNAKSLVSEIEKREALNTDEAQTLQEWIRRTAREFDERLEKE